MKTTNTAKDAGNNLAVSAQQDEMTMEGMFATQEDFTKRLNGREIVTVKIIQVGPEYALVDIGEKKEGLIPVSDFKDEKNPPAAGAEVKAVLEKRGGDERCAVLSHLKALEMAGWLSAKKALEEHTRARGTVLEAVKGGYIVDSFGIKAFMPLSLSELHAAYKHHLPIGAKIKCVVLEIAREKRRLIVSRRQVLEEDEKLRRDQVLAGIKPMDILRVVVSRVGKEALFVRFHGIEGVVRLADLAWRKPEEALKTYSRGQRLRTKLLSISKTGSSALVLGLKQLTPNPADTLKRKYQSKTAVKAKVVSVDDTGMKVFVAPDADGFVPVTEYANDAQPKPGDEINAAVLGVNQQTYELLLSVRRFEEVQNRKIIARYLKEAPPLTLGQLLAPEADQESA